ncbi:MAG: hypothetical protein ACOZBW_02685 [Thermodesulfobacteriota bacterium]
MNCKTQAKKIYPLCVTRAKTMKSPLTYGEVLRALGYRKGVSGNAIRYGLELVLVACAERKLPILTAIVVNNSSGTPSAGEYPDNSWEKEAPKVFAHDRWPSVETIDWEYVWKNRRELSDKYGTKGYWGGK